MNLTTPAMLMLGILASSTALAEKPDWSGKGKAADQQMDTQRHAMEQKGRKTAGNLEERTAREKDAADNRLKKEKAANKNKSDADTDVDERKAREQLADRERKELGKGSEKGQAMREEHSRKWWKIWE